MFNNVYENKKILITGHTGFKGSWLALWLKKLGADILGFSLPPFGSPNHFDLLNLDVQNNFNDIRDYEELKKTILTFQPDIIFHLAAQALVLSSYEDPYLTLTTNIIGTANIYDICHRFAKKPTVIVNVTSDKCYENKEWIYGYRETDRLGGKDPYSVSKACAEFVNQTYQTSFFQKSEHYVKAASVRAGNVIGGGDWAINRIIPDLVRSANNNETAIIRMPDAVRPWQHVLEPLSGYLLVGEKLLSDEKSFATVWNFGPENESLTTVRDLVKDANDLWNDIGYSFEKDQNIRQEACLLKLDCSKAKYFLKWSNVWGYKKSLEKTILWYKSYYRQNILKTNEDLENYFKDAKNGGIVWTQ